MTLFALTDGYSQGLTPAPVDQLPAGELPVPPQMEQLLPVPIQSAGQRAWERYLEFFLATIRNPNTRSAYWTAVQRFFAWCERRQLVALQQIRPLHVSAYVEALPLAPASVKQHLAAIRRCLDWLVSGVLDVNPAGSVKGPRHVVREGKTPVLDAEQTRWLLDSIPLHNTGQSRLNS